MALTIAPVPQTAWSCCERRDRSQGAQVNAKNRLGWTPLMMAGGLYIANAHKASPGSAQILREALTAQGANRR